MVWPPLLNGGSLTRNGDQLFVIAAIPFVPAMEADGNGEAYHGTFGCCSIAVHVIVLWLCTQSADKRFSQRSATLGAMAELKMGEPVILDRRSFSLIERERIFIEK